MGYLDKAQAHYEEAIRRFRQQNNLIGETYNLGNLGWLLIHKGALEQTDSLLTEATDNARKMGDKLYLSTVLSHWVECKQKQNHIQEALNLCKEALVIAQETKDQMNLAIGFAKLRSLHLKLGELVKARSTLKESIEAAIATQDMPLMLSVLIAYAEHLLIDDKEQASNLLKFIIHHEGTAHYVRKEANTLLKLLDQEPSASLSNRLSLADWIEKASSFC